MRFLPWWRGWRSSGLAGNRVARLRKVLEAAQSVPTYEAAFRAANLDLKQSLRTFDESRTRDVLALLGNFTLEQVRIRPRRKIDAPLVFTSPAAFASTPDLHWDNSGCAVVNASAGPRGPKRALLIRIGFDEGLLSPIERDSLWQRYGLPMFEHLVGMDGALLAWECETHSGLHIVEENAMFESAAGELLLTSLTDLVQPTIQTRTCWSAQIETETCDCGRPGPRLVGLREFLLPAKRGRKVNGFAAAAHG